MKTKTKIGYGLIFIGIIIVLLSFSTSFSIASFGTNIMTKAIMGVTGAGIGVIGMMVVKA